MINTINYLNNSQLNSIKNSHSKFYQHSFDYAWNLYSKDLKAHFGCVNALEFSNRESEHIASGGDDRRVLIWSINNDVLSIKSDPIILKTHHHSNIFSISWDNENRRIFSGGNDDQVLVHDVKTQKIIDIFLHADAVFSISVHPEQSEIFATACENGQVSLYDLRLSNTDPIILSETVHGSAYQACCFNSTNPSLIATANVESGLQLIDLRMQNKVLVKYEAHRGWMETDNNVIMSVKFNQIGNQLLALRSKCAPTLYNLNEPKPIIQFDHEDFLNSCTLKSCCFAGDRDQYICSGSDDFCVYVWKNIQENSDSRTSNSLHLKLKGHRSIVNQVRYNSKFHLLISSGVEKIIKVWTPFKLENSIGGLRGNQEEYLPKRKLYTNRELFELRWFPQSANQVAVDSLHQSMEEDQSMIAFFDSLVRREMNNWSNEDNEIITNDENRDESESSSGSSDDDDEEDNDGKKFLTEFLSDNENDNLSSNSSSCSNISMNSNDKKKTTKIKISLRDRLRNLKHRKSMNLTETSEFINVLDSLNVPHGSSNRSRSNSFSHEETLSSSLRQTSNDIENKLDDGVKQEEVIRKKKEEQNKNVNIIKSLNKHRRVIELDEDDDDDDDDKQPTTSKSISETNFKKSKKTKDSDDDGENGGEKVIFRRKRQK